MTIVISDEELWSLRQVVQEAAGGTAQLFSAWPIALADPLIRRLQPEWIFVSAGDGSAAAACRQARRAAPHARLIGVGAPARPAAILELARLGLEALIARPIAAANLRRQIAALFGARAGSQPATDEPPQMIGRDPEMERVRQLIEKVAVTEASVLLRGESGTGKEVAAGLIHRFSARRAAPFIKLNCAAIPHELLESELFGYEAGAFTGAARAKAGKFELARGGTILLDEISELEPKLQAKLLHILQDGEFSRLGAEASRTAEARVVAASNSNLEADVAAGRFRADLFYRLNVVSIRLPPLRERTGDIPALIEHFRRRHGPAAESVPALSPSALAQLAAYAWPGNVRELENFVRRYLIFGDATQSLEELTPTAKCGGQEPVAVAAAGELSLLEIGRRAARAAERTAILAALERTRWNRRQAARLLKISYKSLHSKLRDIEAAPPPTAATVHAWPTRVGGKAQAAAS